MANNCLVTKLKGTVSADLEKLGELTFRVSRPAEQPGASDFSDGFYSNLSINGYIKGAHADAAVFSKINNQTISPAVSDYENTIPNYISTLEFPSAVDGVKVAVEDFYKIIQIIISENVTCDNFDRIQYCEGIQSITKRGAKNAPILSISVFNTMVNMQGIGGIDLIGDTEEFVRNTNLVSLQTLSLKGLSGTLNNIIVAFPNLQSMRLGDDTVVGTFDSIGALTSLTELSFKGTGSIEGLVSTARAAGRTTGSINCRWCSGATFNGSPITSKSSITLSWDASTITFDGVTITA